MNCIICHGPNAEYEVTHQITGGVALACEKCHGLLQQESYTCRRCNRTVDGDYASDWRNDDMTCLCQTCIWIADCGICGQPLDVRSTGTTQYEGRRAHRRCVPAREPVYWARFHDKKMDMLTERERFWEDAWDQDEYDRMEGVL